MYCMIKSYKKFEHINKKVDMLVKIKRNQINEKKNIDF